LNEHNTDGHAAPPQSTACGFASSVPSQVVRESRNRNMCVVSKWVDGWMDGWTHCLSRPIETTPASPSPLAPVNFFTRSPLYFTSSVRHLVGWAVVCWFGRVCRTRPNTDTMAQSACPVHPPNSPLHECSLSTVCAVGSVAEYSQSVSQQHISSYQLISAQLSSAQLSSVPRLAVLVDRLID
jgi:hypothetical protein